MLDLCLTLAENSASRLARRIAEFEGSVPLIEIRLDCLDVPSIPELPLNSSSQFLATCRPQRQGGFYEGTEAGRLNLLAAASERRFNWIDLEYDVLEEVDLAEETSVVRSYHSFQECPSDLDSIMTDLQTRGGDVFKIAVQVSTTSELKQFLLWMESLQEEVSRVVIGMGVVATVITPVLASQYSKRQFGRFRRGVVKGALLSMVAGLIIAVPLFMFPIAILTIFGEEFQHASSVLQILTLGQLVSAAVGPVGAALVMSGRQKLFAQLALVAALVKTVGAVIVAPQFGMIGVAAVSTFILSVLNILLFISAYRIKF